MIKKFILKNKSTQFENGDISDSLTASYVQQKEILLDDTKNSNDFFPKDIIFTPLVPLQYGDYDIAVGVVDDFSSWIREQPKGACHPISVKFKDLIVKYKLPRHRIYQAEVLIKNELQPFSVLQLDSDYNKKLIDFEKSTFCNTDFWTKKKLNDDHEKLENLKGMRPLKLKKGWKYVGFNRAVMKPEFEQLDLLRTLHFGTLISERLKEAIESAGITGVKIEECPTQFEINYDWEEVEKSKDQEVLPSTKIEITTTDLSSKKVNKVVFPYPEGKRFKTQAEVNQFQVDYPDCTEILGTVFIHSGDIQNLNGLNKIERINGSLIFIAATNLESLEGLSNLKILGGELMINDSYKLKNLKGLDNLEEIQSNGLFYYSPEEMGISIESNKILEDISALKKLKNIDYNLFIARNPMLKTLEGMEGMEKVGRFLVIQNNDSLEDISALENIETVFGNTFVTNNKSLNSLKGLGNLKRTEAVEISNNGNLLTIKDLATLKAYFK